jgi:alanine racemase
MLTVRPQSSQSSARDAWVEIDLANLERNIRSIQSWLLEKSGAHAQVMAVVKSDAYGHGAVAVGEVLAASQVAWLAVASVDEGLQLRAAAIKLPILVLSPTPSWAMSTALDNDLDLAITSGKQLQDLLVESGRGRRSARIHIKVDTGMHRLGFGKDSLDQLIATLKANRNLTLVSIFSHLAKADDLSTTTMQNTVFQEILKCFRDSQLNPQFVHLASSEAARRFPFTRYDMVRVGLNLYGLEAKSVAHDLLPVLALRGRINQISTIEQGQSVGYGLTWTAKRKTKLAVVPIGYADGIDRRLSNRMAGLLAGQQIAQVGTISMDQMSFDITDVPSAQEGDVITLIGSEIGSEQGSKQASKQALNQASDEPERRTLHLADWAQTLGTITYELSARLRIRLPRIYTRRSLVNSQDISGSN